jgi:deazaflavin-dependent oxidoreductase (nitroreductase family)
MGWNDQIIAEFRTGNGRVGGPFEGVPMVLLTTAGRTTGRPHTTPAAYLRDEDRYLVFASNAGRDHDPDWYRNLIASPQVTIELGTDAGHVQKYAARAVPLGGEERDRLWERQCAINPAFREYEAKTTRIIPVVALYPLDLSGDPGRARAIVEQLRGIHRSLRDELAEVRTRIGAAPTERNTPGLLQQLRAHCLTYCHGLRLHHTREDGAFTAFEARFPELVPAIARLRAEHAVVERVLGAFEEFLAGRPRDAAEIRAELDKVVAGLEEHFTYEEAELLTATTR